MPRIQQYTTQTEAAGPIDLRSARNADTGETGNALANVGAAINDIGSAIEKRQAQSEVSDLAAQFATLHAQTTNDLQDTLQSAKPGDTDIASNFIQDTQDNISSIGDNVSTTAGKDFFKKASAEYLAHFSTQAQQGQAQLAGEKAVNDNQTFINQSSSALVNSPSSFDLTSSTYNDYVDSLVKTGALPAGKSLQMKQQGQQELAKSAVYGWNNVDPQVSKQKLMNGDFDQYFDGDTKQEMLGRANMAINAQAVEAQRQQNQKDLLTQQTQETEMRSNLHGMVDGSLTAQDIVNSPNLTSDQMKTQLNTLHTISKENFETNPAFANKVYGQIYPSDGSQPSITSQEQISSMVGPGKLSIEDATKFSKMIEDNKTPEGKNQAALRGNFINGVAKSSFIKPGILGRPDPEGESNLQGFLSFAYQHEAEYAKSGKPVSNLYNSNSPDYMGQYLNAFKSSPAQVLAKQTAAFSQAPTVSPTAAQTVQQWQNGQSAAPSIGSKIPTPAGAVPTTSQPKLRDVSPDEITQYAAKHTMTSDAAKQYLGGLGYGVH